MMENSEKIQPKLLSQNPLEIRQNVMPITPLVKKEIISEL